MRAWPWPWAGARVVEVEDEDGESVDRSGQWREWPVLWQEQP